MNRSLRLSTLLVMALLTNCATLQDLAALRNVSFAFDRVSQVRIAGVLVDSSTRFTNLGAADAALVLDAVSHHSVPIELVAHVRAENPAENQMVARMLEVGWKFFVQDQQTLEGLFGTALSLQPGKPVDVPVAVRFDLVPLTQGGAREVIELGLAIAGYGGSPKELRLELRPTIETALGPMRYPTPVVVRRTVGTTTRP
ncbi:MAG: hypothetical protein ABIU54_14770 [Candidatus Eisenbacteria bacterium]